MRTPHIILTPHINYPVILGAVLIHTCVVLEERIFRTQVEVWIGKRIKDMSGSWIWTSGCRLVRERRKGRRISEVGGECGFRYPGTILGFIMGRWGSCIDTVLGLDLLPVFTYLWGSTKGYIVRVYTKGVHRGALICATPFVEIYWMRLG